MLDTIDITTESTVDERSHTLGTDLAFSDQWNTKKLVEIHGQWFRWNASVKAWFIWDNKRWIRDDKIKIEYLAKLTVRSIYEQASKEDKLERRRKLAKWGLKSESVSRVKSMVEMAKSEPGIAITTGDLDNNEWLLNCANCTVNLDVALWDAYDPEIRITYPSWKANDPLDLISKCVPVAYDPTAECPAWERFIFQICGGDAELMLYLRRCVGYSLTGSVREHCYFFCYGTGSNGKSTFINIISDLLGDYAKNAQPETFMKKSDNSAIRSDIARLVGARFVTANETEDGQRVSESLLKQLSAGDSVTSRHLFGSEFEYRPTYKIWFTGNHKPNISGTDEGIWRRVRIIPFTVTIADKDKDKDLPLKLKAELPGILNWALEGLRSWSEVGLGNPLKVEEATNAYRMEMDHLGTMLNDMVVENEKAYLSINELYIQYQNWCDVNGEHAMSKRVLSRRLMDRKWKKHKLNTGWVWIGKQFISST